MAMTFSKGAIYKWALGGALALGVGGSALAQDKHDITDLMLTNKRGELCTMCEASMVCTSTDGAASTSYKFYKRGFFGQMSTVLDYFPFTRAYGLKHKRPVDVISGDKKQSTEAAFDLTTKRITVPDGAGATTWVDRTNGVWHNADDSVRGQCTADKI